MPRSGFTLEALIPVESGMEAGITANPFIKPDVSVETVIYSQSMSRDWETDLTNWSKPASDSEESRRERTEKMITDALNADPAVKDLPVKVYAKGSYANRTNVRTESDVDINVEYHGIYYYEFMFNLEGKTGADFGFGPATGTFPEPEEFKNLVQSALKNAFGSTSVVRGDKAIEVHEQSNSIAADVVPCFSYRRYSKLDALGNPDPLTKGTKLFPDTGSPIINWPQQHYDNGVWKNKNTKERYKKMVRCLKRLENEMVDKGKVKETPSYLIECLVYNVPNENFGKLNMLWDFRAVLAYICNETSAADRCSQWVEVNELKYLFRNSQKWTWQQAHQFAIVAWIYVGFDP
jgi:hypothetical protein